MPVSHVSLPCYHMYKIKNMLGWGYVLSYSVSNYISISLTVLKLQQVDGQRHRHDLHSVYSSLVYT